MRSCGFRVGQIFELREIVVTVPDVRDGFVVQAKLQSLPPLATVKVRDNRWTLLVADVAVAAESTASGLTLAELEQLAATINEREKWKKPREE
jgi:hypothetical protein